MIIIEDGEENANCKKNNNNKNMFNTWNSTRRQLSLTHDKSDVIIISDDSLDDELIFTH